MSEVKILIILSAAIALEVLVGCSDSKLDNSATETNDKKFVFRCREKLIGEEFDFEDNAKLAELSEGWVPFSKNESTELHSQLLSIVDDVKVTDLSDFSFSGYREYFIINAVQGEPSILIGILAGDSGMMIDKVEKKDGVYHLVEGSNRIYGAQNVSSKIMGALENFEEEWVPLEKAKGVSN